MPQVFVALGSNVDPEARLSRAARLLRERFPDARFSPCYCNAAVGFDGADFINAVAGWTTSLAPGALLEHLHEVEALCGRPRATPKWGPRAMDLDLLLYDERVEIGPGYRLPRPDLTRRAYMLGPLAALAPQWRYPPAGPSIGELWAQFPRDTHALHAIELDLNALAP